MASALDKVERDNFFSLTLLLFRPGNKTLRTYFKSRWLANKGTTWVDCPSFGHQLFNAGGLHLDRPEITKVRSGNTESWDMTVLIKVLRFSYLGLTTPGTTDDGELINLKDIRNQLICHADDARLQTSEFTPIWDDACNALTRFGMSQQEIDDVENDIRQPWKDLFPMLQQFISQENDKILESVKKVDGQITLLHQEIQETERNILAGQQTTAETVKTKVDDTKCDILAGQQNVVETVKTIVDETVMAKIEELKDLILYLKPPNCEAKVAQGDCKQDGKPSALADVWKPTQAIAVAQNKEELQGIQQKIDQSLQNLRDFTPHSTSETGNAFQARPLSHDLQRVSSTLYDQMVPSFFSSLLKDHYTTQFAVSQTDDIAQSIALLRMGVLGESEEKDISMHEVFKPGLSSNKSTIRTVLIEGTAGAGKTSFCHELVLEWANGRDFPIDGVEFVLLLNCRLIDGDIWQAIEHQLLTEELAEEPRKTILFDSIINNQEKVLIILDGFDELSPSSAAVESTMDLIIGKVLPRCHIIVRTRTGPEAAKLCGKFDSAFQLTSRYDVHGFIYEYFRSNLLLAANFVLLIDSNPNLKEICPSYPMAMLCEAYKRCCKRMHGSVPIHLSSLYAEIVYLTTEQYCRRSDKPVNNTMKLIFQSLGQLAFDGLMNDQWVFQETRLLSDYMNLGFIMMVDSTIRTAKSFSFVHSSFQEYFAVHYFVTCLKGRNHQVLCTIKNGRLFEAVHHFDALAQIKLSTPHTREIIQSLLTSLDIQRTAVCTFVFALIGCLQGESEISSVVCATAEYFPKQIDVDCSIYLALSGFSYFLVPRVLPLSNVFEQVQTNSADDRPSKAQDIKEILFHQLPNEENMQTKLFDALFQLKALKCLRFGTGCNLSTTSVLLRALKPPCLTELSITQDRIASVADVQSFIICVLQFESLTKLNLTNIRLGVQGAKVISFMLMERNSLRTLTVSGCELGPIGCGLIARVMRDNTSLETLDISGNGVGNLFALDAANMLEENKTIQELVLADNFMTEEVCKKIAGVLQTANQTLRVLDLSRNKLGDWGACLLFEALAHNRSLQCLRVSSCRITNVGMRAIVGMLKNGNTTLTHLFAEGNSFDITFALDLISSAHLKHFMFSLAVEKAQELDGIREVCEDNGYEMSMTETTVTVRSK